MGRYLTNKQEAPYPDELEDLVTHTRFRPGYQVWLTDTNRGQSSNGLTLVVKTEERDTYHPDTYIHVCHYFIVPAASYNRRSWQRWLFDQLRLVSQHEDMEFFRLVEYGEFITSTGETVTERVTRPYAPLHGPGNDPYLIAEVATDTDRRTSFRGEVNDGNP